MKNLILTFLLFCSSLGVTSLYGKNEPANEESVDNSVVIDRIGNNDIDVAVSTPVFTFKDADVTLTFKNPNHTKLLLNKNSIDFIINGENVTLNFVNGVAHFSHRFDTDKMLTIFVEDFSYSIKVTAYPLWAVIVPLVLIVLLIVSRMMKKK